MKSWFKSIVDTIEQHIGEITICSKGEKVSLEIPCNPQVQITQVDQNCKKCCISDGELVLECVMTEECIDLLLKNVPDERKLVNCMVKLKKFDFLFDTIEKALSKFSAVNPLNIGKPFFYVDVCEVEFVEQLSSILGNPKYFKFNKMVEKFGFYQGELCDRVNAITQGYEKITYENEEDSDDDNDDIREDSDDDNDDIREDSDNEIIQKTYDSPSKDMNKLFSDAPKFSSENKSQKRKRCSLSELYTQVALSQTSESPTPESHLFDEPSPPKRQQLIQTQNESDDEESLSSYNRTQVTVQSSQDLENKENFGTQDELENTGSTQDEVQNTGSTQDEVENTGSTQDEVENTGSTQDEVENTQDEMRNTQDEVRNTQDEVRNTQDEVRNTQDEVESTQENYENNTLDKIEDTQNNVKSNTQDKIENNIQNNTQITIENTQMEVENINATVEMENHKDNNPKKETKTETHSDEQDEDDLPLFHRIQESRNQSQDLEERNDEDLNMQNTDHECESKTSHEERPNHKEKNEEENKQFSTLLEGNWVDGVWTDNKTFKFKLHKPFNENCYTCNKKIQKGTFARSKCCKNTFHKKCLPRIGKKKCRECKKFSKTNWPTSGEWIGWIKSERTEEKSVYIINMYFDYSKLSDDCFSGVGLSRNGPYTISGTISQGITTILLEATLVIDLQNDQMFLLKENQRYEQTLLQFIK